MRDKIVDYKLVIGDWIGDLGEEISTCVADGWEFLNKHGIKNTESNTFYVEMVKYEEQRNESRMGNDRLTNMLRVPTRRANVTAQPSTEWNDDSEVDTQQLNRTGIMT